MGARSVLVCLAFAALLQFVAADPIWKVFCDQNPVFRGRADPIVEPGMLSQHSHKVFGANNFGIGSKNASAMEYFNHIRSSSCTSCSISIDLSNYWIPDLYYEWENGSFSLVPNGGMTVYYLSRSGSGNQSKPDFQPFPDGLRMTSGSPVRRSYSGTVKERAISYACLGASGPETPYFPTNESICTNGLRAQVWFPMCWDGVNLDSPNHQSHMSHPIEAPDHGNCPSTHPVRLPGVFFETLFDVNPAKFPHGKGTNPFRWACGDSTGYGLHGDFLNGWDKDAVRAALKDPKCDNNNKDMAFGNNVKACPPLAPYVKDSNNGCYLNPASKVPTIEDLGVGHLMNHMPGCNPVTHGPANAVACKDEPTQVVIPDNFKRVLIKSALNGMYLMSNSSDTPIKATISPDGVVGYSEVFLFANFGTGWSILSEGVEKYVTAANSGKIAVIASKGGASGWETFDITQNNDTTVSFVAQSNSKILSQQADGTLLNSATTITTSEKFYLIEANGQKQVVIPNQPLENNPAPDKDYDSSSSQAVATIALVMVGLAAVL